MTVKLKNIIRKLAACKVHGICDRDKVATDYLRIRTEVYERRMQTINEIVRSEADLPPCPPDCETVPEDCTEDCEKEVTVECEKEVTITAKANI